MKNNKLSSFFINLVSIRKHLMIFKFIWDYFFKFLLDKFLLYRIWLENILYNLLVSVLKESKIILKSKINEIISPFLKIFHFQSLVTNDSIENGIIRFRWRCLFGSHNPAKSLHHLPSWTFIHSDFYRNISIRQINSLITNPC